MSTGDAYWVYQNVPIGTSLYIFYGNASSDPMGKPALYQPNWEGGYDPTDPDFA